MRTLILGGTGFLGRHLADAAVARGHAVTLFHRGRSSAVRRADVEHVLGDRNADLQALAGRTWDVVFDTSGYEVPEVRVAAQHVGRAATRYVFVSTISVYAELTALTEDGPVRELEGAETAKLSLENYGALKVACERSLEAELPGRVMNVRAGLILGPHDYDERFPWWLRRIARGGDVIAPGDPDAPVQWIDARDLVSWMVTCAERGLAGTYNATGPDEPLSMRALLDTMRQVTNSAARFVWVPDEDLVAAGVAPYSEMPFWLPQTLGRAVVDVRRARALGLTYRPFADTARDTWAWLQTGWDEDASARDNRRMRIRAGLSDERERSLIAARAR